MTSLPIIKRPMDNTALSAFMTCPREFNLSMLQGWNTKQKSQALSFGAFWHRLLETHYKSGGSEEAVLDTFIKYQSEVPDTGDYRTAQRAFLEYKRFRKAYKVEKDVRETLGYPDSPMVEISTSVFNEILGYSYAGKLDRIVKINSEQGLIEDHKTTSRFSPKTYFKQFRNSNQMKGYTWLANQVAPGIKIIGVRINLLHVLTNKSDFHRHIETYSESQIREWEHNTASWLKRIEHSIQDNDFPGHFGDNGCKRVYGHCQFFDVCATNEVIRQSTLEKDFEIRHWDPLADEDSED